MWYANLSHSSEVLSSKAMKEIFNVFMEVNHLQDGQRLKSIEIIDAVYDETNVSPEGIHQDGFDHRSNGIHRDNVVGGEALIYNDNHSAPSFKRRSMMES